MLPHKKISLPKFCLLAALLCLSPGATAARGAAYPSYGANTANTLVVGGAGTTITFAPKNPLPYTFFEITGGMKSSDRSTFKTEVTLEGVGTLTVLKDPGGSDRTGWVVLEYRAGAGSSSTAAFSDTVYLVQPAEVCVDPKMGSKGADFFVAFMQNAEYTNGMSLNLYATADSATTYTVYSYDKGQQVASGNLDEKVVVNIFTEKAANMQAATYNNLIAYNRNAEAVYKKSLLVHAEKPVSLYAYNVEDRTSDASHIIPLKALLDGPGLLPSVVPVGVMVASVWSSVATIRNDSDVAVKLLLPEFPKNDQHIFLNLLKVNL